ncbi:hypothetical protein [Streptomyces sp. CBMA123]|uniref:hypothetical protein n=1 Tax=Streptomyces sp. CBMA123 TaxID=1896313 RepID=UPI001661BDDD|nr:hypothetical protein [Streptomyces sp. CBMA123]MBD0689382.1 hypothetical protein [Streptomyces sp. CBMA123]
MSTGQEETLHEAGGEEPVCPGTDVELTVDQLWSHIRDEHAKLKAYSNGAPDFINLLLLYLQEDMGNAALHMLKLRKMRVGRTSHATREFQASLVAVAQMALVTLLESTEDAPAVFRSELRL